MNGLFDTKRNLLTTLLVGGIGVLTIGGLGQAMFLGRADVDRIPMSGAAGIGDSQVDVPDTGLADFDDYTSIIARPVFFSDRRLPVVEVVEVDDDLPPPDEPADNVEDLRARIAGIIITPDMRMAMVRDEKTNRTLTLREGMSLEGEQAAWRLDTISPRMVSFVSVDGRNSELELKVNTAGLTAGSPGMVRTPISRREAATDEPSPDQEAEEQAETGETAPTTEETDARARAEEVRRRVAERRAELRAEAERRAQMQQQQRRQDN